jgi:hypothetical protein
LDGDAGNCADQYDGYENNESWHAAEQREGQISKVAHCPIIAEDGKSFVKICRL